MPSDTFAAGIEAVKPCPFCGSHNIDPAGWRSLESSGPACDDCGASAGEIKGIDNIAAWNLRRLTPAAIPEVDWAAVGHEYAQKLLSGGVPQIASPHYGLSGAFTAMANEIERLRATPSKRAT